MEIKNGITVCESIVESIAAEAIKTADILEEVIEIEHHLHNKERWYGKIAGNNEVNALENSLTPFRITSGVGTYGVGVCVVGTADVLVPGTIKFDLHEVLIASTQKAELNKYRWAWGTGTEADAITAGNYSTKMTNPIVNTGKSDEIKVMMPRLANGTKVWLSFWSVTNTQWTDIFIGGHGYKA
jgi:hypothetical protein